MAQLKWHNEIRTRPERDEIDDADVVKIKVREKSENERKKREENP